MPKPTWIKTCESCAWFDDDPTQQYKSTCRSKPPGDNGLVYTRKDWWCARYQNIDDVNKWCDDDEPAK